MWVGLCGRATIPLRLGPYHSQTRKKLDGTLLLCSAGAKIQNSASEKFCPPTHRIRTFRVWKCWHHMDGRTSDQFYKSCRWSPERWLIILNNTLPMNVICTAEFIAVRAWGVSMPQNHVLLLRRAPNISTCMGYSRRNKIPRCRVAVHMVWEKGIRFRHTDYEPDRAQNLSVCPCPDTCRHATFHPNPCTHFWVILHTHRRTNIAGNCIYLLHCAPLYRGKAGIMITCLCLYVSVSLQDNSQMC